MKIVSWTLIYVYGQEGRMSDFPVIENIGGLWWLLYTFAGIAIPVMLWGMNDYLNKVIRWKIKEKNIA